MKQTLTITKVFEVELSPNTKEHLQQVMLNELTAKGLKPYLKDGEMYI